jgi:hypothetical protein
MSYLVFISAIVMGWAFLSIVGTERTRRVANAKALADAEAKKPPISAPSASAPAVKPAPKPAVKAPAKPAASAAAKPAAKAKAKAH